MLSRSCPSATQSVQWGLLPATARRHTCCAAISKSILDYDELNGQADKQFSYRRDELVGQQLKSIIPEDFAERLNG
jgi:hypothetical protein